MKMSIEFVSKEKQRSKYDWADLSDETDRIGKVRCRIKDRTIVIYSINIYPKWEGHGYGREFVDYCKTHFEVILADRVRPSVIGFWRVMGFHDGKNEAWVYQRQ